MTKTELDDILKHHYPKSLGERNLLPIINKFSSINNKILIDYKQFQIWLKDSMLNLQISDTLSNATSVMKKSKS